MNDPVVSLGDVMQRFAESVDPTQVESLVQELSQIREQLRSERSKPRVQQNRYGPTELYRIYSDTGELLYVGISRSYRKHRYYQHSRAYGKSAAGNAVVETYPTRQDAEIAEVRVQAAELPRDGSYETDPDVVEAIVERIRGRYKRERIEESEDLETSVAFTLAKHLKAKDDIYSRTEPPIRPASSAAALAYDASTAAEVLGVPYQTMLGLMKRGDVPFIRVGGRRLVRVEDLRTFVANQSTIKMTQGGEA